MNHKKTITKVEIYSGLLMSLSLVAALLFNGSEYYLLSLSWVALIIGSTYIISGLSVIEIKFDLIHIAMILFVVWMLLSLYWHPAPWRGIEFNWRLGIFFYTAFVAYLFIKEGDEKAILTGFFVVAAVDCLYALYQSVHLGEAASGFFLNKNNNVAFLNLFLLPVITHLLFHTGGSVKKIGLSIVFVLLLFALIQAVSRGGLLSLSIASTMVLAFAIYEKRISNILLVLSLVLGTFVMDAWLSTTELRHDFTSYGRWYLYTGTLKMIGDAHWYGIGNGMFPFLYPAYRNTFELSAGNFVHNDYMQILLELGVPGFSLLFLMMALMAYKFRKLIVGTEKLNEVVPYIGYFAAILAVSIHSMLTFNFYKAGIVMVMGLYFGLLLRKMRHIIPLGLYTYSTARVRGGIKLFVTMLMLLPLASVSISGYADAVASGVIDRKFYDLQPIERYRIYNRLSEIDTDNYKYPARAARALYRSGAEDNNENRREIFLRSRTLLKHAQELDPLSSETYIYEIDLLEKYKDVAGNEWRKEAVDIAFKVLNMNPRWLNVRIKLARLLEGGGEKKDALIILMKGLQHIHLSNPEYYYYGKMLAGEVGSKYAYERFSYLLNKFPPGSVEEIVVPK